MTALVARKRACLAELHDLAGRQLALINADQMTDLFRVLDAKQRSLGALAAVERELAPFREQRPEDRAWPTAEERACCRELLAGCERLLAETLERERAGEELLRRRRDQAAERLAEAAGAVQAREAYAAHDAPGPRRLDLHSGR
jgi:hypothetical protein